ncbi:hypothetical protein H4R34_004419 [Dimargaris verticillata]|uniref:Uncharacterized protein n=1 Tax=Dimargaris verticillata TaxID=2761393 RepID=A0A9W8EBQ0_9FUNG|nr:hypothetical protein H4R34_004419 [Dimargaris verticillata]
MSSPNFHGHHLYQFHHRYDESDDEVHPHNSPFSPTFQLALNEIQSDDSAKSPTDQLLERERDWFSEIQAVLPTITPELRDLSVRIFENPEVGGEERLACQLLSDFLASHDFTIEREPAEMETAFIATYESPHYDEHSKVIGFFAE